ncbi:MAG TPA: signal recognition particle subunit SRP19/SEC65 family protein [Nitrososphaerales archaeon]|nr:signal recognition particle subunit SRP19/SEC65 family protein [Nitrososphaerales archaeon]
MKEYERVVVWLDYLDSEKKRSDGRRVPLNSCVRAPTLDEMMQACKKLGFEAQPQKAFHPRAPRRQSGYVSIVKKGRKQEVITSIAREMSRIRGSQPKKV